MEDETIKQLRQLEKEASYKAFCLSLEVLGLSYLIGASDDLMRKQKKVASEHFKEWTEVIL